ncbi:MAG: hypothetical protein ACO24U_09385 [Prochlorococcaceae cyanobacterium]
MSPCTSARGRRRLWAALTAGPVLAALLAGCVPAHRRASWAIYPLQRRVPHDGLAVVSQPDGYGLHIWVETDTSESGRCKPRWSADPARLFNGNGSAPFSSGLASQVEFFEAVARADVRRALRRLSEALCKARAPRSSFVWLEPPRQASEVKSSSFPLLEGPDLISDPNEVLRREDQLLGPGSDGEN